MKKLILLFIQILFIVAFAKAQENKTIRYFNSNHKEISEKKFKELRSTNKVLDIIGDSTNHRKLIEREETGNIERNKLVIALEKATKTKIDSNSTIIIVYYPGKDPCNSSGSPSRTKDTDNETEKEINRITNAAIFYIYKDFNGLERFPNHKKYIQDPNGLIEQLFFKHHYPCNSFVAIAKKGNYKSYFGEFSPNILLNALKSLKDNK